jgi:transcriptional regulator with XRE-family HTH domain
MGPKRQGTESLPFAKILKRVISERGLTVRAAAEMAGVSGSVVQSWLNSANPHDLRAVATLAKALNMEFKELLLGEVEYRSLEADGIDELFEEKDLFEGFCKVSIKRLLPKKESR